jgi:hypothetical protein
MKNIDFGVAPLNGRLKVSLVSNDGGNANCTGNVTPFLEGVIVNAGTAKPVIIPWTAIQKIEVA